MPFAAGIPERVGTPGHWRRTLLTKHVLDRQPGDASHQVWEYFRLLGLEERGASTCPNITPPGEAVDQAEALLGADATRSWVAVLPGAARGGSKRWPAARFAEVANELARSYGMQVVVLGTDSMRFPILSANSGTKCHTRTGMSSRRSLIGGIEMGNTFNR